jgi:hypothetical protein
MRLEKLFGVRFFAAFIIGMLSTMTGPVYAAADAAGAIDWGTISTTASFWYLDAGTNKPAQMPSKYLAATTGLIETHVQTDTGEEVEHYHMQYNYGDAGRPTVADANAFWNARFGGITSFGNASTTINCHTWAFEQKKTTGSFGYWTDSPGDVYGEDYTQLGNNNQVQAGDLERYADNLHTTYVNSVFDQRPGVITWKWNSSGLYVYGPLETTAFDTPMCVGDIDDSKTIDAQGWTWSESGASAPDVYHK